MNLPLWCQQCGGPLDDDDRCPRCGAPALLGFLQREFLVLAVLSVVAVTAFLATRGVAQLYADIRERDAAAWYRTGQAHLANGHPEEAAEAFRHATAMARENQAYRLALAAALTAHGRDEAARQVLLGVRALAPEHPEANLRLARLEARRDDESAAVRYYQNALYGVWEPDRAEQRASVRVELIEYLLARGRQDRALAELLALEGNLPAEPAAYLQAGHLFRRAGDPARALAQFERVLARHPKHADAAAGAAEAAFSLGDYARAQRHLRTAPADRQDVVELRQVTSMVLARDPLAPRLSYAERRRRLIENLTQTADDVGACSDSPEVRSRVDPLHEEAQGLLAALARRTATQSLETIETGVDLVYRLRRELADRCGASGAAHRALLIIGERHQIDPS